MKKIKKKICKSYELFCYGGKYQKQLQHKSHTSYDTAGRIIERLKFEYRMCQYERRCSLKTGIWQMKTLSNTPRTSKHRFIYKNDQLVAEHFYSPIKKLAREIRYEYDSQGNLQHAVHRERGGVLLWESFYEYDKKGQKKKWIDINHSVGETAVWLYCYDKKGRNIATECWSKLCGYLIYKYEYDRNGNLVGEACYSKPGVLDQVAKYAYDEKGRKTRFEILHQGKKSDGYVMYERDKKGNILVSKSYNQRLVHTTESQYNKYGRVISTKMTNYFCDCTGVRVVPYQLDVIKYEYF